MSPFDFIVISLATWRMSHLLSREDGPFDIFDKIRLRFGAVWTENAGWVSDDPLGKLIICPLCISFWFAIILFFLYFLISPLIFIIALSGVASLLQLFLDRDIS